MIDFFYWSLNLWYKTENHLKIKELVEQQDRSLSQRVIVC